MGPYAGGGHDHTRWCFWLYHQFKLAQPFIKFVSCGAAAGCNLVICMCCRTSWTFVTDHPRLYEGETGEGTGADSSSHHGSAMISMIAGPFTTKQASSTSFQLFFQKSLSINPHQAAPVDTHASRLLVAGRAIKHAAKIVVKFVTQGQTVEFTGVRA